MILQVASGGGVSRQESQFTVEIIAVILIMALLRREGATVVVCVLLSSVAGNRMVAYYYSTQSSLLLVSASFIYSTAASLQLRVQKTASIDYIKWMQSVPSGHRCNTSILGECCQEKSYGD